MKKFLTLLALIVAVATTQAQNPFFDVVNYRGAFAPAPASPWTDGWVNWDPQHVEYAAPTKTVSGNITVNTTWKSDSVILLSGLVYVKPGATLTILPGTIVRGDATVANSSLVITKGAKINAIGTSTNPIVFTSSRDTGARVKGDWGGIIILGKSTVNKVGGVGNIEGIATSADTEYGGGTTPDDNDNSGNLKFVRIEFGGYIFNTDQEINGLTLGAVGRNTIIDYVQCSYINDDAFEWFGGTVNCSHLVAYKCLDDNFDTDNGYSGSVQFCLGVRDPGISDQSTGSTSEGFESDNDAAGSTNAPQTSAVFSNVTDISGFRGTTTTSYPSTFRFRRGARIRRNSGLKLLNSILMDAPYGVFIDGAPCRANLQSGVTVFKNNIVAGNVLAVDPTTTGYATVKDSLFNAAQFDNDSSASTSGILVNPYDYLAPDYRPVATTSLALSNVNFTDASIVGRTIVISAASHIREVSYRGAFAPSPSTMWTDGWTNWDPINASYPSTTVTVNSNITSNTTWTSANTYLLSGLVYVTAGVTLTIEPGTIIKGDATVSNSSLIITKGAKINAVGTVDRPIVFTSSKDSGTRAKGDWGGIILLGRGAVNNSLGIANIEGIAVSTNTEYGGGATPNSNDNSGTMKYVRIEFGGYIFNTDQEINGLTMGAVGRGTVIDFVQCSYINDDAFEWFGGSVNCAHLVAYKCLDDNFDTDFGFNGAVQFCLGVRDPLISDQSSGSTSEGFESDNDAAGSSNSPQTRAIFSNVTDISGFYGTKVSSYASTFKFRRGARIRRNSGLRLFNSILMDAPFGLYIDGSAVRANLQSGVTKFKNNLIAGSLIALDTASYSRGTSAAYAAIRDSIFGSGTGLFKNDTLSTTAGVLTTPYNYLAPDYRPATASLALTGAAFTDAAFNGLIAPCDEVNAPAAMTGNSNLFNCVLSGQVYSIPAIANASNYYWTVPVGCTITAGQGTRTITVTFATTFVTGTINVVGKNDCGNSSVAASKLISKTTLGAPSVITAPVGFTTNVCSIVSVDTSLTYSITTVAGATNYVWTNPSNTTIVSGQGTNSIKLKFLAGFTFTVGDSLRVYATSGCKTSAVKALAIKTILPTAPASITIASIAANVCGARTYRYSAPALPAGATGYLWSLPTGAVGSTGSLDSGSLSGRVIVIKYTSNDAVSAVVGLVDSIKVRYTSNCGLGLIKGAKLSNTKLSAPAAPSAIVINALGATNCGEPRYRYIAPAVLPVATTTAGAATGYSWSIRGQWTLGGNAVLDSGDLTSQKIVIRYLNGNVKVAGDSVKLQYTSDCGLGSFKALTLSNTATGTAAPAKPASITIAIVDTTICGGRKYRYTAPVLPAATAVFAAPSGYVWTLPTTSIGAVLDSGSLTGKVIVVSYTSNNAAATGDSMYLQYSSACGLSAVKGQKLTNLLKANCLVGSTPVYSRTINTANGYKATVAPNPNNGNFTVRVETGIAAKTNATIQILDMNGRLVSQINTVNNNGLVAANINNNNLNNGIYIVKYTVGNVTNTIKMVVQK